MGSARPVECPECGKTLRSSSLSRHRFDKHDVEPDPIRSAQVREGLARKAAEDAAVADPEAPPAVDVPPRPKTGPGSRGGSRPKVKANPKTGSIPLKVQLELPYKLGADVLRTRMPHTSGVLRAQAPACAEAWDVFLLRYPALRESIEKGMIAGDVIGLIMAHVPIITAAREEMAYIQAQNEAAVGYDGGIAAA